MLAASPELWGLPSAAIVVSSNPIDNLPLAAVLIAALLYWRGGRVQRRLLGAARMRSMRHRDWAFAGALALVVVALGQPLDDLAAQLFWAHMLEHVLLLVGVAPLLVLAAPWMRLWRGLPLALRRPLARGVLHARVAAPLRAVGCALAVPLVAWIAMNGDLIAWHIPALYDLTLRNEAVHDLEHLTFVVFSVVAWAQVIESPPLRVRLTVPWRIAFALGSMVVGWALAVALAYASAPWYSGYADLAHRPGGLSALTDQRLGAGIMWVPASLPWTVLIFVLVYRWIADSDRPPSSHAVQRSGG
ncbi:MAG TPA: cytochrome c oxidase assembly protein [Solirubrobacteraceae bacterium]|nr:cytochrome c oxidase assembly protein [Solirubrobacteraceae bacterium]